MIDPASQKISSLNWQIYQRLKLALGLGLRRQIFVAVCDDLTLRNLLAARLQAELADPSPTSSQEPAGTGAIRRRNYPGFVSLSLNLQDPHPMAQVTQWLAQYSPPVIHTGSTVHRAPAPAFQILGVERLTRQPAPVQRLFLNYLQGIERDLPALESSLVLWMPQPWYRTIQQSVPEFWQWHTGTFEFVGDPTPAMPATSQTSVPLTPPPQREVSESTAPSADIWKILAQDLAKLSETQSHSSLPLNASDGVEADNCADEPRLRQGSQTAHRQLAVSVATSNSKGVLDKPVEDDSTLLPQPQNVRDWQDAAAVVVSEDSYVAAGARTLSHSALESSQQMKPPAPQRLAAAGSLKTSDRVTVKSAPQIVPVTRTLRDSGTLPDLLGVNSNRLPQAEVATCYRDRPQSPQSPSILPTSPAFIELADLVLSTVIQEMGATALLKDGLETANLFVRVTQSEALGRVLKDCPPFQTLRYIYQLDQLQAPALDLAGAYRTLGSFYRDRIEQGDDSTQTIFIALRAYEQVLERLDNSNTKDFPWSDVLNDLGNLYWMLSRRSPTPEVKLPYLTQGIKTYQMALTQTHPSVQPQVYAMIQNNLGAAYGDLARYQETAGNLQRSILAYQEALQYRTAEVDPLKYAATQNNLATTYWHLAQHQQPMVNLRQAIAAYQEALQYYNPQQEPMNYAMLQNNLGTAYWNLAHYEPDEGLLTLAIKAYTIALQYRTPESSLAGYSATQNNLGTAYWHLANQLSGNEPTYQAYLQEAIAAYTAALNGAEQLPANALTFDRYATHNNLGLAHYQIATDSFSSLAGAAKSAHLEAALLHHLYAMQGWQHQPDFYQTAITYIVQTIRAFYNQCGLQGQNLALSMVPGELLPELLQRL
ncbi:MAG: hypothetical protein VKJ46_06230 [Leptolyngbyaceae bacterium]|nr:hypothetical protein [Leptolyngbyaceae bacterium]